MVIMEKLLAGLSRSCRVVRNMRAMAAVKEAIILGERVLVYAIMLLGL